MTNNIITKRTIDGKLAYGVGREFVGFYVCRPSNRDYTFMVSDVIYAQANDKYVDIHLANGTFELFALPLNKVAEVFGDRFLLVSRKTLVRRALIVSWGRSTNQSAKLFLLGVAKPIHIPRRKVAALRREIGPYGSFGIGGPQAVKVDEDPLG